MRFIMQICTQKLKCNANSLDWLLAHHPNVALLGLRFDFDPGAGRSVPI